MEHLKNKDKANSMVKNEMTLQEGGNNTYALKRNGMLLICPFRQPIISQEIVEKSKIELGGSSEPQLVTKREMQFCSSVCAMFKMTTKADNRLRVELCCGKDVSEYIISEVQEAQKPQMKGDAPQPKDESNAISKQAGEVVAEPTKEEPKPSMGVVK